MPVRQSLIHRGYAGATFFKLITDTAKSLLSGNDFLGLGAADSMVKNNDSCIGCIIHNDAVGVALRYAFGIDPSFGDSIGHVLDKGDSIELTNPMNVRSIRFVRNGAAGFVNLQATPYFAYPAKPN